MKYQTLCEVFSLIKWEMSLWITDVLGIKVGVEEEWEKTHVFLLYPSWVPFLSLRGVKERHSVDKYTWS